MIFKFFLFFIYISFFFCKKAFVTYHTYSETTSLYSCSCSNGYNGLIPRWQYDDISSLFPYVSAFDSSGWNSPNCGKCMKMTRNQKSIYFTIIDLCGKPPASSQADSHFDLSSEAFSEIFGSEGVANGNMIADYEEADPCLCKGNKNCQNYVPTPKKEEQIPAPTPTNQAPAAPTPAPTPTPTPTPAPTPTPTPAPTPTPTPTPTPEKNSAYVTYHNYDSTFSLNNCACSNGDNGLITKWNYDDVSAMYPYIGAFDKSQWNSPNCGKCMGIAYNNKKIYINVVDFCGVPPQGYGARFEISPDAFKEIFGDKGIEIGSMGAIYSYEDPCKCKANKDCKKA